jgi:hypothetical protein
MYVNPVLVWDLAAGHRAEHLRQARLRHRLLSRRAGRVRASESPSLAGPLALRRPRLSRSV